MGWIAKNLDDTGSQSFVNDMMNGCRLASSPNSANQYSSCSLYKAFEGKKAIFNAEYKLDDRAVSVRVTTRPASMAHCSRSI